MARIDDNLSALPSNLMAGREITWNNGAPSCAGTERLNLVSDISVTIEVSKTRWRDETVAATVPRVLAVVKRFLGSSLVQTEHAWQAFEAQVDSSGQLEVLAERTDESFGSTRLSILG
jgi:hypothetical protein